MTKIFKGPFAPNPKEFSYWADTTEDPKGSVIKYYSGNSLWTPLNETNDTTLNAKIANLEKNKVDKVLGKALSTNDFTDEYKTLVDKLKIQIADLDKRVQALETLAK